MKATLWDGGVPPEDWRDAPSLKEVIWVLSKKIHDCILVGHGLGKDIGYLRLRHPKCAAKRVYSLLLALPSQTRPAYISAAGIPQFTRF